MSKYKIAYISKFTQNMTGTARSLVDTAAYLDRSIFQPMCILPRPSALSEELEKLGAEIYFCEQNSLSKQTLLPFMKQTIKLIQFFKKDHIDLVHVQEPGSRKSYVMAAKILKIPIIIHLRNPYGQNGRKVKFRDNFSPFFAKKIIANSIHNSSPFSTDHRFNKKVKVIYNGIDTAKFSGAKARRNEFIERGKNTILVGTVGQICARKGIKEFIEMIPCVIKKNNKVQFLVVGADAAKEQGYSNSMKKLAYRLGVDHNVIFTGYRTDVTSIMKSLDIFVLASHSEPFGRVIVEAMAAGKPVVATRVGGIPEIISSPDLGLLVKSEDTNALAEAVLKYANNEKLRMVTGRRAFSHAKDHFSVEAMMGKLTKIYLNLLKSDEGTN